jgi:hypothetical protein
MMLQPGCRFVVAPLFHLPDDWPRRLLIGASVEEADGCFFPLHSWRPPTLDELSLLVRPSSDLPASEELDASVCLFQLPGHLGTEWWNLLEQNAKVLGDCRLPGFEIFVKQVNEFLAFKGLPIPEDANCVVVVSNTGQWSVHRGLKSNRVEGMHCSVDSRLPWPSKEAHRRPRLWGGINLGDEEASISFINLPCEQLHAELHRRFPDQPSPATVGELAARFLRHCSDYPPVRLLLGPGEGCRLPQGGLILGGVVEGMREPDVLLLISQPIRHEN